MEKEFTVSPWEVSGDVDYDKLIKEFGASTLDSTFLNDKKFHPVLRRGLYFSQRDFSSWLKAAESGKKVSIVTGRGPSEKMHIGHLIPFLVAKSLQDKFGCHVYIPISDDEKFFVKNISFDDINKHAEDNILDIIALGFNPKKTFIFRDFSYPIYPLASQVAKLITYSEAKAVFGLQSENNIGWSFFPAVQTAHILMPQFKEGKQHTLVPVGIDQDPYIRLSRDVAAHSSLNFIKPSTIHSRFLPGLKGTAKMSSSDDEGTNLIYLNDDEKTVKAKINKYAFSGGKDTLEEHRKHGGNPDVDISFLYLKYIFEEDDKKLQKIREDYKSGKLLSGELKAIAIEKINSFLKQHQKAKQKAKKQLSKFILKI